jgi:hypothetical protein
VSESLAPAVDRLDLEPDATPALSQLVRHEAADVDASRRCPAGSLLCITLIAPSLDVLGPGLSREYDPS